jgi:hypothetical protein
MANFNLTEKDGVLFNNGIAISYDAMICQNLTLMKALEGANIAISIKDIVDTCPNLELSSFVKEEDSLRAIKYAEDMPEYWADKLFCLRHEGPVYKTAFMNVVNEEIRSNGIDEVKKDLYEEAIHYMNLYISKWRDTSHKTVGDMIRGKLLPENQKGRYYKVFTIND